MRRSEVWFFGVIFLMIFGTPILVFVNKGIPDYYNFWWALLLPYVFIKMTYIIFPQFKLNTRFYKWLETKINKDEKTKD